MRSLAIAEEAISQGIDCVFVGLISDIGWLQERVVRLGFSKIVRPGELKSEPDSDVLVLDSYSLELNSTFIQPEHWSKIVLIADSTTPEYFADLVIHPGLDGSWYSGDFSKFLWGSKYIPLRNSMRVRSHEATSQLLRVLVFGGGTDTFDFAFAIAGVLRELNGFSSVTFFSKDKTRILNLDSRFTICDFGPKLDSAMHSADLVFTTASTSALEVIACGIPVGVARAVSNQSEVYLTLGQDRLAALVGDRVLSGDWIMDTSEIKRLVSDPSYRLDLVNKGAEVIDFQGASRIIAAIIELNS
jgi:spore coat polysaccharide biosynthesis predicted glycosyltransferase SpsG